MKNEKELFEEDGSSMLKFANEVFLVKTPL